MFADILNWMGRRVTNRDMFSKQITMTYKGQDSYRTFLGGCFSVLSIIIMAIFSISWITMMISKTNIQSKWNRTVLSADELVEGVDIMQHNLFDAIIWFDINFIPIEKEYGTFEVYVGETDYDKNEHSAYTYTKIELED